MVELVDTRDLKSRDHCGRAGSSPARGTKKCGSSSVGRARPCQGRGREFESRFPLKSLKMIRVMIETVPKRTVALTAEVDKKTPASGLIIKHLPIASPRNFITR